MKVTEVIPHLFLNKNDFIFLRPIPLTNLLEKQRRQTLSGASSSPNIFTLWGVRGIDKKISTRGYDIIDRFTK